MNRDEIARMAREAASEDGTTRPDKNIVLYAAKTNKFLERFAALVAAAEREACVQIVEQCQGWRVNINNCSEVKMGHAKDGAYVKRVDLRNAIRARGQS